jgi:hypothetical protein
MKKNLITEKPLLFLGDNHGSWDSLLFKIRRNDICDVNIISVGDLGVGFYPSRDMSTFNLLNKQFEQRNINFYGIRGNHDDPSYFKGKNRVCLNNFELIEDYSVFKYGSKLIQFIGGAISIDRTGRKPGVSYWENEGVIFNKYACQKVDILVTHTAPSWCFPQHFNEIVYGWAGEDAYLIEDLTDERAVMDEIFKLCAPSFHLYGHFHSSWSEKINGCISRLLNIDELYEYPQ